MRTSFQLCLFWLVFYRSSCSTSMGNVRLRTGRLDAMQTEFMQKRALSELIFTDRDKYSIAYSGKEIDWENYGAYISDLACHCSKKTAEKDYSYFGLQFYGECWSGPHANETYAVYGDSNNCINEFYKDCELLYDEICIGRDNANFIYTILASPGSGSGDS